MKSIAIFLVLFFIITPMVSAQIKPDQLKSKGIRTIVFCLNQYSRFAKTGDAVYLIRGTKYASEAGLLFSLLKDNYPKSIKDEDAKEIIETMDALSANIPERFIDDPASVRQDPGFITYLHLTRIVLEDKLGELPEENNEE